MKMDKDTKAGVKMFRAASQEDQKKFMKNFAKVMMNPAEEAKIRKTMEAQHGRKISDTEWATLMVKISTVLAVA